MSGGSSVPKAPDLSGNVDSANATAKTATSDAAQTMNTATAYNANAQSNLSNVTNTTNSMAGQIGSTASQNLSTYGSSFVPLQSKEASDASNYGSDANVQKLQGQAVANVNTANQAARSNSAAALASEGVDPASIHGAALDRQNSVQQAGQTAAAATQSATNTKNTAFSMENTANQLGLQVGAQGTSGAAQAASTSQSGQNTINSTNSSGVNNLTAANSYLNSSTNANNSAVSAANTQFQDQAQADTMQNSANNSTMSAIGSVAGAAAMFMEKGGTVPEHIGGVPAAGRPLQMAHSGLPVSKGSVRPRQAIPMAFEPMFTGGPVTTRGALPVGAIPGTTDRKPAMLTPGEFVVPKDVVDHLGTEKLHKLVDKTREDANKRRAIPVPHAPHMSMH
ncbi:MAG: hypothetical protein M3O20_01140 [Acidobacteriota bacterium]|nr:hypothetical protein [Acidobacteriota bacterium]